MRTGNKWGSGMSVRDITDFCKQFKEVYSFKENQQGRKTCKYCRYYKTRLSAQEAEGLKEKETADFFERALGETEFSICKKASKMALKVIEEDNKDPIITAHNGYCRLYRVSILKIIKSFFHKGNK